jgi:general secretion pathway protein K
MRQQGFALVLVLWVLSLLIIMSGSFALNMRREAAIVAGLKNNAQAMAVAESALSVAELMLMHPDATKRWRADGSVYEVDFAESKVRIQLRAEVGKIDINNANEALLKALISHAPDDEKQQGKLVNAIQDWRDADDLVRVDGAEKSEYKKAGLSYQPRNKRFRSIEELQLVLGVTEETYQALAPLITVYSGQDVDLRFASREVLEIMPGLDAANIEQYLLERKNTAMNGLAPPSTAMLTAGELSQEDSSVVPPDNQSDEVVDDAGALTGVFEIFAEAQLEDGSSASLNALVEKADGLGSNPFTVLKWQRNQDLELSLFSNEETNLPVMQYAEPEFNN